MLHSRVTVLRGLSALVLPAIAAGSLGAQAAKPLPIKYSGPATVRAITAGDLMTRLYIYADDSMGGRDVGTIYHQKATAYIEREVRKLGLKPGGTNGSYFQDIQVFHRSFDVASTLTVDGVSYKGGVDFLANTSGTARKVTDAPVLVWYIFDSTFTPTAEQLAGKVIAMRTAPQPAGPALQAWLKTPAYTMYQKVFAGTSGALGTIAARSDSFPAAQVAAITDQNGDGVMLLDDNAPLSIVVTNRVIDSILAMPLSTAPSGTVGKPISAEMHFNDAPRPGRNVIAILPGSDPKLRGEYVAIGAHNDHVGTATRLVGEHDSLKVYNTIGRPAGAEGGHTGPLTAEEWAKVNAGIDSLRKIYPSRPDSIFNGADDDGSGTVSVLEMAEAFAKGSVKPKRSMLFIWHAGEEHGMWGSGYFTDHPTVPRDSIMAEINIDMVGRGAATDVTGREKEGAIVHGGEKYVQLVGSRRLSTELGDLAEAVNKGKDYGFKFDYSLDANGHPQNIYCRSDHEKYAAWGIPVVFFTTGGHADYHQVTDEPQYIRYSHMANLDRMIFDLAVRVADLDHRLVVDGKKMDDPHGACQQ